MDQWRNFVRDLEIEVVASDMVSGQMYNEIRLSIDGNNDGQATDLGAISFLEAGTGSGNYNAVKMKSQLDSILAQFESTTSDNAHVLEQFFGMDDVNCFSVDSLRSCSCCWRRCRRSWWGCGNCDCCDRKMS